MSYCEEIESVHFKQNQHGSQLSFSFSFFNYYSPLGQRFFSLFPRQNQIDGNFSNRRLVA